MSRMSLQAASTMNQLQHRLDTIGNNIANVNTHGFKTKDTQFSSLLKQQFNHDENQVNLPRHTPDGVRVGTGARLGHTNINLRQGSIQETGRALDVALQNANQFFQVMVNENGVNEVRYTRSGNFYLNEVGNGMLMLVNSNGHPVVGDNGQIIIQENMDELFINENGELVTMRNGNQQIEGRIAVVESIRPRSMEAAGENLFRISQETLDTYGLGGIINDVAAANTQIKGGALEASNVDMAKQMADMMETQRAYQFNARTISMADQMSGLINSLR
ncbi:flagellar basal-body rod protein FlgG [Gracilibacillus halotolerans]|uniref:Flagellar basal-body rod protein FlgG n=1 Tax=Gracilibacillus halotolerans TaxID=74386 RepID=A0A841RLH4_9BACI|nr:flagellar hook-basal body protein [Gracilibacillus halotolerans]MBB6513621.1 flagellar basal-body rod protein FlgG [Gracilibacillus halotolerans]